MAIIINLEEAIKRRSSIVNHYSRSANIYGCEPCPICKSKFRCVFNNAPNVIECDDCGYKQDITEKKEY